MNQEQYLQEIRNRVDYYAFLSQKDTIAFDKLEVLEHPELPNKHFLHLKYALQDEKDKLLITTHEEIETFVRARKTSERGWLCAFNDKNLEKLKEFLDKATISSLTVSQVTIKSHEHKKEVQQN